MKDATVIDQHVTATPSNGSGHVRNSRGQFLPGNGGGPGNPHAGEMSKHRAKLFAAAKGTDAAKALSVLRKIMMGEKYRPADRITAANAVLDRLMGKPIAEAVDPDGRAKMIHMFIGSVNVNNTPPKHHDGEDGK